MRPSCFRRARHRAPSRLPFSAFVVTLAGLVAACGPVESLRESFDPPTAHERYAASLRQAGLDSTALGRDWLAAAQRSLERAPQMPLPFREAGYFSAGAAAAVAYRIAVRGGQRLVVEIETQGQPLRLFVDVFRVPNDTARGLEHVTSGEDGARRVEHEAGRDGVLVIRLQPELLRGARYLVSASAEPTLAFPLPGRTSASIQSRFGADRDGGRRRHQGVDIFAPRGTPVLAAADGFVRSAGTNALGGKVVWVWDPARSQSLYYAHLDSQLVRSGQTVRTGDTLGMVGNTGNARSTAPHLHFGIYRRGQGAVDPYPFLHRPPRGPARLSADTAWLGDVARVVARVTPVRTAPEARATALRELPRHSVLRVDGASGAWYRVRLPDETIGYVAASAVGALTAPVRSERTARPAAVRDLPAPGGAVIDTVGPGSRVAVLGRFADFLSVRREEGRTGWIGEEGAGGR
jgi:murein DD-endopeptidase MepM/ murein hydrolase activator NlpD